MPSFSLAYPHFDQCVKCVAVLPKRIYITPNLWIRFFFSRSTRDLFHIFLYVFETNFWLFLSIRCALFYFIIFLWKWGARLNTHLYLYPKRTNIICKWYPILHLNSFQCSIKCKMLLSTRQFDSHCDFVDVFYCGKTSHYKSVCSSVCYVPHHIVIDA